MKTILRTTALAVAVGLFGLVGTAHAERAPGARLFGRPVPGAQAQRAQGQAAHGDAAALQPMRTPAQTKAALAETAQKAQIPHFVNASGKIVYNPHAAEHMHAVEKLSTPGSGVLQIMQMQGNQHTLGHFEGKYIHFQYRTGTSNWRLRTWADKLRPSSKRMFGAMIQLSPKEAENMRTRLAGIFAEQGPEEAAGRNWENGHITGSVGVRHFNCASAWCEMPIGEKGESVAQLIGIPSSGEPFSLQRSLETGGNEKIVGIGLFGSKQERLGHNPNERFAQ